MVCTPPPTHCLPEQGWSRPGRRGRPGFRVSAPPPQTGPGRNPECAAPTLGGALPRVSGSFPTGESRLGSAAAQTPKAPGCGHSPPWATRSGALRSPRPGTYRLGSGLCLPPAIAVETGAWGRRGGAGAGGWKSEALGSACLMKERGAIGDTEILIRGSLWGGIYYSVLIGCVVASQHPGPGRGATQPLAQAFSNG